MSSNNNFPAFVNKSGTVEEELICAECRVLDAKRKVEILEKHNRTLLKTLDIVGDFFEEKKVLYEEACIDNSNLRKEYFSSILSKEISEVMEDILHSRAMGVILDSLYAKIVCCMALDKQEIDENLRVVIDAAFEDANNAVKDLFSPVPQEQVDEIPSSTPHPGSCVRILKRKVIPQKQEQGENKNINN